MANNLKLWINAETGRLLSSGSSFVVASQQTFHAGDTVSLELHLIAGAGVARAPYEIPFPAGATIKVAVGTVAKSPLGGQWRLSVSSTETTDLAFNAAASAVETALNALTAVSTAGGVTVSALGGGYSITWNTVGTKPSILSGSDTLTPSSYESILVLQAGDVSTREIVFVELRQSPLALATTFAPIGSPSVSTSIVSSWNSVNQVIRVNLVNSPKSGFWTLTLVNGVNTYVSAIQVASSSNDVRNSILASLIGSIDNGSVGSVSQTDQGQYDIVLTKNFTASVDGTGLVASDAVVGDLALSTSELIAFLSNSASAQATLEISTESAGNHDTLVQVPCTVANAVVAAGAVGPVPIGTLLTETVANARFIRKDLVDAPSTATQDILWQNLGVTTDGSDTVAAINASVSPASGNPFLTVSDGDTRYAAVGSNPFDQSLNTTDSVEFASITTTGYVFGTVSTGVNITANGGKLYVSDPAASKTSTYAGIGITFPDATFQDSAFIPADYLTVTTAASTYLTITTAASTYALQSSFDQSLKTTDSPSFVSITAPVSSGGASPVTLDSGGIHYADSTTQTTAFINDGTATWSAASIDFIDVFSGTLNIASATGITFADATVQNSAPVFSSATGQSGGTGSTIHHNDYPDEVHIVIGGVNYAMPARIV